MLNGFKNIPRMKPPICRFLMCAGILAIAAVVPTFAQSKAPAEVEVSGVKFNTIRLPNSSSAWYETSIELTAKPTPASVRFTGRVKVALDLGLEITAPGGKKEVGFYRASAELVALETGRSIVRFYLPPEVVKRDAIRGDAKYYYVELTVDGQALPPTKDNVSFTTLGNPQVLDSFRSKIASDAAVNDGILLPQYLTPFFADSSRPSPSFVRMENAH